MDDKELKAWEESRDIGAELLQSVREMKAGKAGRIHKVKISPVAEARFKTGLSQAAFAKLLGVSKRTLQEWEQGRRKPSGAASALLKIAEKRPDVLREVLA
ncbi:MAG: helix-turn-helix domain-containing protein [Mariprofundaceae bacterium]|nr:helix-turn-helix domain-containing protein [Mariprofundaceae bacterium]